MYEYVDYVMTQIKEDLTFKVYVKDTETGKITVMEIPAKEIRAIVREYVDAML